MTELHRAWLELVDTEGPFLAIPALKRVWPQGMPALSDDRKAALVDARKDFEAAWEGFDRTPDNDAVLDSYRVARDKWVETVLRDVAGWAESLSWGEAPGVQAQSPNRAVTVTAHAALNGVDGIGALVHVVDPTDSLRQTPNDLWAATPVDRTEALLRENKVPLGLVTDGRWWGLVCAREGVMAASGIVDALTWIEEPRTRDAFLALIGRQHIIGGDPTERLPVLFEESVAAAEEITEALGAQVRSAVELLIQSFSESAADAARRGLPDPLPARTHDTYEAAVTVMMRVVFLLFAEERGLLPSGELFDQGYGIARELDRLIARETEESEEALDSTSMTWHRLLATSQALFSGASFENLRMPAYGGSLFDPERFEFLTAVNEQGTLAVTVSDRVMLHVLRSVQIAEIRGEGRRISFRDIDVEQIGYIYEGLLGYTASIAGEVTIGLKGSTVGEEPEISLAKLESLAFENQDPKKLAAAIRSFLEEDQPSAKPQSVAAIAKGVGSDVKPSAVSALTQAVGDDFALRDRVKPWLGLIRLDLRKRPFVVLDGGLLVTETPSRKNAGAHYTPKSLAEEVVLHALQPLCYSPGPHQTANEAEWKPKTSYELLDLKVADIACGSGAFLVASARYLADRVVEAWTAEEPANAGRRDLYTRAIRQVVANCLYGADINDMAVEMCKLSLWLVSLDRELPFSFVDDKVFLGNSLLGITNLDQLRKLHIDPTRSTEIEHYYEYDVNIDAVVREAVDVRRRLATEIDESDPGRTSTAKRRQLTHLYDVTAKLRRIADGVVAAGLRLGGKSGKPLDEAYQNLRIAVKAAYPEGGVPDATFLDAIVDSGLTPTVETDYERWQLLHWVLEAPDVMVDHGGFDAVIGNPPFFGGKKISGALGSDVREWLVETIADGVKGSADVVAYFFLRAASLLNASGCLGLLATDTLAQGETREVGLAQLLARGFTITRSIKSRPWPAANAVIDFATVWGTRGAVPTFLMACADGVEVPTISSYLDGGNVIDTPPQTLRSNTGLVFQGCVLVGRGFVISKERAERWIARDSRNRGVLFPLTAGDDLANSPSLTGSSWVIDFNDRTQEAASSFVDPFGHVERTVRPERAKVNRKAHRERWWQFGDKRPALRKAIVELERVIVVPRVSKYAVPVRVRTGQVFTDKVCVVAREDAGTFGVLSSTLHSAWVMKYTSTRGQGLNYSPTDVLETFPFPGSTEAVDAASEAHEETLYGLMRARAAGVTSIFNALNSPADGGEISLLRRSMAELDNAVLAAYGWSDISLDHGFHTYRQMERWTVSPAARVEILDRLLEENHRRAADEGSSGGREAKPDPAASDGNQARLFDDA